VRVRRAIPQQIGDYLAVPARHDLRQIVERGLNERAWKPYAQKPALAEQILILKVQNAYDVIARGQSDFGYDVAHSIGMPLAPRSTEVREVVE
jgi:hypothetical protein